MQEPHGKGVRANSSDGKQGSAGCGGGAYRYGPGKGYAVVVDSFH